MQCFTLYTACQNVRVKSVVRQKLTYTTPHRLYVGSNLTPSSNYTFYS